MSKLERVSVNVDASAMKFIKKNMKVYAMSKSQVVMQSVLFVERLDKERRLLNDRIASINEQADRGDISPAEVEPLTFQEIWNFLTELDSGFVGAFREVEE